MTDDDVLLDTEVTRRCNGRTVLDRARLTVRRGTIHALVGENGAGKSSLVQIVAGVTRPEPGGRIDVRAGSVGLVRQHGALVPTLSIVENAVLGREGGLLLELAPVAARLRAIGAEHGLAVEPGAIAGELSVGEQQRAELVIALWRGAELLMLDEPTAVLAPVEVEGLFAVLRRHVRHGAVVLVTHKLDEVVAIADDVTVLRGGVVVERMIGGRKDAGAIARAMVGGEPPGRGAPPPPPGSAAPVLEVRGLAAGPALHGVDLEVAAGEIVGVAGVEGNGQRELGLAIAGLLDVRAGRVRLGGADLTAATVRQRHDAGLGHLPEDRQERGLVLEASIAENLALGREREVRRRLLIDRTALRARAAALIADLDVRPPDVDLPAAALSGGNQQKVVVARELTRPGLRALVAAQPTRGVDVAAQALIHDRLRAAAGQGLALLVISADLDELLALCHRIVVLHRGRIVGAVDGAPGGDPARGPAARARLGALMTGAEAA